MVFSLKKLSIFVIILLLITASGCCRRVDTNPSRPNQVRGWQEFQEENIKGVGEFVLNRGDSVNNGRVGVKLINTIQARACRGTESAGPSATVQFYRVSDKKIIWESDLPKGNTSFISFNPSLVEYGLGTISIHEINTKEGWIWFELWK